MVAREHSATGADAGELGNGNRNEFRPEESTIMADLEIDGERYEDANPNANAGRESEPGEETSGYKPPATPVSAATAAAVANLKADALATADTESADAGSTSTGAGAAVVEVAPPLRTTTAI